MKRHGTVLVFKKTATKKDIDAALKSISYVLEENYHLTKSKSGYTHIPFRIEEFDDEIGGPVWYLP